MRNHLLSAAALISLLAAPAALAQSPAEIGYEKDSLAFSNMVDRDWSAAEQQLAKSESTLGDDPARLLQLAEVYRVTGRSADAESLYKQVLSENDMKLVLADGRIVSAHGIASTRLSTEMMASAE